MSLFRRKLWGDRVVYLFVVAATAFVVYQYFNRDSEILRLYILIAWGVFVAWLVGYSELRIGRKQLRRGRDAMFLGLAAFVGEERMDTSGERHRGWTGAAPGALAFEATGIRWVAKDDTEGPSEDSFTWSEVYSWRFGSVIPLVWRASGYLLISLYGGRELLFHIHGMRSWRRAVREAAIVGPTLAARHGETPSAPPAQADAGPLDAAPKAAGGLATAQPKAEPEGGAGREAAGAPPIQQAGTQPSPPTATEEVPKAAGGLGGAGREAAGAPPIQRAAMQPSPPTATKKVPTTPESQYEAVIGLECHVELSTASKMFCGCPTTFGAPPNSQICPVCTGQPGTLPVPNRAAVEYLLRIALALNSKVADRSIFHRKNYFYPDMPKNYQISQYDIPMASGGYLDIEVDGESLRVRVHRVHIEEDTGKTIHGGDGGRISEAQHAMIDYNRAGVPLVEIVSEPDISTPEQARAYLTELRGVLLALGVSDVRMEEGSLRCDANVSIRPKGATELGTKTEVKNMNSVRSVQRALAYEIDRQLAAVQSGKAIAQETRHFDESSGQTIGGRSKEYSSDYRYFPDPDLVPLVTSSGLIEKTLGDLPELPARRRRRYADELGLAEPDARALAASPELASAFESAVSAYGGPAQAMARWYLGELSQIAGERGVAPSEVLAPGRVAELQRLVDDGRVSISLAKGEVLRKAVSSGRAPTEVVEEAGLAQISDESQLESVVDEVIGAHPDVVAQVRGGKTGAVNALVGQVMKRTKGQANAQVVQRLLATRLETPGPGQPGAGA